MQKLRRQAPWFLGMLLASLLFALLFAFSSFQYGSTEDASILRSILGYEGGQPATFHLYLHTGFAWLLWGLTKLMPGIAWFSLLQLLILWFSQGVIVKSLAQLSRRRGCTVWPGAFTGALFLAFYAVQLTCRVSFMTTAALAGGAAVAQLAGVDFTRDRRGAVLWPFLGSTVLLLCAYGLRQLSVLPPLCFWALTLLTKLTAAFGKGKRPLRAARPVLAGVLITALLLGGGALLREAEIRLSGTRPLLQWHTERIRLLDSADSKATATPETLSQIGWSVPAFTLFTAQYFLDDALTLPDLRVLHAQQTVAQPSPTLSQQAATALANAETGLRQNPALQLGFWAALGMATAALWLMLLLGEHNPAAILSVPLAVLGGVLMMLLASLQRRPSAHALACVLYPLAAFVFAAFHGAFSLPVRRRAAPAQAGSTPALPSPASASLRKENPLAVALLAASLALCLWAGISATVLMADAVRDGQEISLADRSIAQLDAYAQQNPSLLFIYDTTLLPDTRMFPLTPVDLAGNALFWGGNAARTPRWYAAFAKYGHTRLDATLFLQRNVLLASTMPRPLTALLVHIAQAAGKPVAWAYADSSGDLHFFRFYTP